MTDRHSTTGDTIVAVATAPGRGGVGILRLSGPKALAIGEALCGRDLPPRRAVFAPFQEPGHDRPLDRGIALAFPGPDSFTGEDVAELHAHGSPVVLDLLLQACCRLGARLARPGEFTERAFLNDKMDLAQAEAVADLIASTTESGARGAVRSLQGEFSKAVNALIESAVELRVQVEAAIDFPEEEIDFLKEGAVGDKLAALAQRLERVAAAARQGSLIQQGMKLVIAGRPNAGKSSLLNALSGQDAAIVSAQEGTTRDVLREHIQIDGLPLHIVDTAGLRDSADAVEREGVRRAWREMETADRILLVVDGSDSTEDRNGSDPRSAWPELRRAPLASTPLSVVRNKCDLTGERPGISVANGDTTVTLSAKTGAGIDLLKQHLVQAMGFEPGTEPPFLARRRHLDALERAGACLQRAQVQLDDSNAGELVAEDLRQCHNCLGEITGAMSSDELLGRIFSSFCIGK